MRRTARALIGATVIVCVATLSPRHAGATVTFQTMSPQGWVQQQELRANVPSPRSSFGFAVALSGDGATAIVGSVDESSSNLSGAAWVFVRNGSTWKQQAQLGSGDGRYGGAVALSGDGNTALVGAGNQRSDAGVVYVYARHGTSWSQVAALTGTSTNPFLLFGLSLALDGSGNTAIIGTLDIYDVPGSAFIFTRTNGKWSQQATIMASDASKGDFFGWWVAISGDGDTAIVGAPSHSNGDGAAYIFGRNGATWTQEQELSAGGPTQGTGFATSVSLDWNGTTALISAPRKNEYTGAADIFVRSGGTWVQQEEIDDPNPTEWDDFGDGRLSGDGNEAIISAPGKDNNRGAAFVFTRAGTTWIQRQKLSADDGSIGDYFGSSLGLVGDGRTALIGAAGKAEEAGAAYAFTNESAGPQIGTLIVGTQMSATTILSLLASRSDIGAPVGGTLLFRDMRLSKWPTSVALQSTDMTGLACEGVNQAAIYGTAIFNGAPTSFAVFANGNQLATATNPLPNSYRIQAGNGYDSGAIAVRTLTVTGCSG